LVELFPPRFVRGTFASLANAAGINHIAIWGIGDASTTRMCEKLGNQRELQCMRDSSFTVNATLAADSAMSAFRGFK
jgi:hypothetical protein